jgi:hypothetical protein
MRFVVLLLLLANGAYFAWREGHLAAAGFAPYSQREPQRSAAQIKPEAMRVLSAQEARRQEASAVFAQAAKPTECLQSGLLSPEQASTVARVLQALPASSWAFTKTDAPARWIVYMGKYPSADAVAKKKIELRQLGVGFENLRNATLEPGIALGGYNSQDQATVELNNLTKRGVRTARVVQESNASNSQILRLPAVDEAARSTLPALKDALGGKAMVACTA